MGGVLTRENLWISSRENTPNGQLNPGRVVLRSDGEGYFVYVGVRRYHALKLLYETTKDERFGYYTAYIDTGMDELQMFVKAKRENDEERGERQGLSVLEEVWGISRIKDAVSRGELDNGLRRLLSLAENLGEKRLWKLYEIEVAAHFKFRLAHLEHLCKIENEEDFYLTAANAAGFGYRADDMTDAEEDRKAAYNLEWFSKVFPEYKLDKKPVGRSQEPQATPKETECKKKGDKGPGHLEAHEEGVIVASCPRCRSGNMVEVEGEIKATHIPPDPEGERKTEVTESVSKVCCVCSHCQGQFYFFVKHVGGGAYAVESSVSKKFREPKETLEALDLRYDFEEKTWQRISEGKVIGPQRLAPSRRKG